MELTSEAIRWKNRSSGESFIYGSDWGRPLFYSPDGVIYFELLRTGFGGNANGHSINFEDPHHNRNGELKRKEGTLTWLNKTFKQVECPMNIEVVPLPTVRAPEYLFRLVGGIFIYVSANKYNYSYESFKFFLGKPGQMKEFPVLSVDRYRDGGTTYIKTSAGTLFSPTPFKKPKVKPTWDGEKIKELQPDQYTIEENDDTVKITKK